jgi:hypothetical protein
MCLAASRRGTFFFRAKGAELKTGGFHGAEDLRLGHHINHFGNPTPDRFPRQETLLSQPGVLGRTCGTSRRRLGHGVLFMYVAFQRLQRVPLRQGILLTLIGHVLRYLAPAFFRFHPEFQEGGGFLLLIRLTRVIVCAL